MAYEFKGRTQANQQAERGSRRPARAAAPPPRQPGEGGGTGVARSPMQTFAALVGAVFLLAGIAGFIPGLTSNYDELEVWGPDSGAKLLGLFEVSIVHNIVHMLFGVGLVAAARYSWSRMYLLAGGLSYLVVVLYGAIVDRESDANFLPINSADNVLHLVLALGMIGLALLGAKLSEGTPATRY